MAGENAKKKKFPKNPSLLTRIFGQDEKGNNGLTFFTKATWAEFKESDHIAGLFLFPFLASCAGVALSMMINAASYDPPLADSPDTKDQDRIADASFVKTLGKESALLKNKDGSYEFYNHLKNGKYTIETDYAAVQNRTKKILTVFEDVSKGREGSPDIRLYKAEGLTVRLNDDDGVILRETNSMDSPTLNAQNSHRKLWQDFQDNGDAKKYQTHMNVAPETLPDSTNKRDGDSALYGLTRGAMAGAGLFYFFSALSPAIRNTYTKVERVPRRKTEFTIPR